MLPPVTNIKVPKLRQFEDKNLPGDVLFNPNLGDSLPTTTNTVIPAIRTSTLYPTNPFLPGFPGGKAAPTISPLTSLLATTTLLLPTTIISVTDSRTSTFTAEIPAPTSLIPIKSTADPFADNPFRDHNWWIGIFSPLIASMVMMWSIIGVIVFSVVDVQNMEYWDEFSGRFYDVVVGAVMKSRGRKLGDWFDGLRKKRVVELMEVEGELREFVRGEDDDAGLGWDEGGEWGGSEEESGSEEEEEEEEEEGGLKRFSLRRDKKGGVPDAATEGNGKAGLFQRFSLTPRYEK